MTGISESRNASTASGRHASKRDAPNARYVSVLSRFSLGKRSALRWCEEETDALEFLKQITQRHRDTRNSVPTQHAYDGNLQQNRFSYDVFVNYRDQTDGSTVLLWLPKWPYAHREACTQHGHRDC